MELTTKSKRRLILSLGLSIFFAILTQLIFDFTKPKNYSASGKKPIARLVIKSNSAEKKATKRLIWQDIDEGDAFISGEQIRTGSDSSMTIEILESHTTLELEPNSLITIETDHGKPTLDFIRGNMFISSTDKGSAVNVKSDGKVLDLSSNKVEISKSDTGAIDVDQLNDNSNASRDLVASFPEPHQTLFTDKTGQAQVEFKWLPINDKNLQVVFQLGSQRENLKTVSTTSADALLMSAELKPGIYYWRLIAMDQSKHKSTSTTTIRTLKVLSRKAPVLISPNNGSEITYSNQASAPVFRWTNPDHYRSFDIELAKDKAFEKVVMRKRVDSGTSLQIELDDSGEYFCRVHANVNQEDDVALSPTQSFHVKQIKNITTPEPKFPEANSKLKFQESRSVQFTWKESVGAETYKLQINNLTKKTQKTVEIKHALYVEKDLEPGRYSWQLTAQADGAEKKNSVESEFEVLGLSGIPWPYKNKTQSLFYYSAKPEIRIEWQAPPIPVASYKLKVGSNTRKDFDQKEFAIDKSRIFYDLKLAEPGLYDMSVEGLDEHGEVIAKSDSQGFDVEPMPLLPAPVLQTNSKDSQPELATDSSGNLKVRWNCMSGAKNYQISIFRANSAQGTNEITTNCFYEFRKQAPGQFAFSVVAIDDGNRAGRTSSKFAVKVPSLNQLPPPKILKSKVE